MHTPFLQLVAQDLLEKTGGDFRRTAVVFPGKRADLFFGDHLLSLAESQGTKVLWAPDTLTISSLFSSLTDLRVAGPIETVCRLYRLFVAETESTESLDHFFGWGERLLADFDDVDKNRADARRLFRNLADIKALDTMGYLDDEQERVLKSFFADFSPLSQTEVKERFLKIWNALYPLYEKLRETLADDGLAYEGAARRRAIERLEAGEVEMPDRYDHFAFIGFNVLDRVERDLFTHLKAQGKAWFYWDYDTFYVKDKRLHEAGLFLRDNLLRFPGELDSSLFNGLSTEKDIHYVASPTDSAQARFAASWVKENLTAEPRRTAIVVCDDRLLLPLLHTLPAEVGEANISKGFPLHHTRAYRDTLRLTERALSQQASLSDCLQTAARTLRDKALITIGLLATDSGDDAQDMERNISTEFVPQNAEQALEAEAYFRAHGVLLRLAQLAEEGWLDLGANELKRLLTRVLRGLSVPFHGEPAVGLQVLGLLETRCLDFERVLMLSCSEGILPQVPRENSFIPYAIRREYGLTLRSRQIAVYAYYFFRLMQRVDHATLVYNNTASPSGTGEMSRLLTSWLVEGQTPVTFHAIQGTTQAAEAMPQAIEQPADLTERLTRLSPSAINTYLRCGVAFFYQYVARLRTPDPEANIIEPQRMGDVFHHTAQLFYADRAKEQGGLITPEMLDTWLDTGHRGRLMDYIEKAMDECKVARNRAIVGAATLRYMVSLLRADRRLGAFEVMGLEQPCEGFRIPLGEEAGGGHVELVGTIDRLDRPVAMGEGGHRAIRIVDYKTGGHIEKPKMLEDLFTTTASQAHYTLQTFIYSLFVWRHYGDDLPIHPALFFVHHSAADDYSPEIKWGGTETIDFRRCAAEFEERLGQLVTEIFNPDKPFVPTEVKSRCRSCQLAQLCGHNV